MSQNTTKSASQQEENNADASPTTNMIQSAKPSQDRLLYNAMKRQKKQLDERETEVKHQERINQYTAIENNLKNENEKVELKKAIVEFSQQKLEDDKQKALFEIEKQGYYLRMQGDLQKLALQKFKLGLMEWFYQQFKTLDLQKIQLAMQENRLLKEKAISEIAKRENELHHQMQRLSLKDWESALKAEESKLQVDKNQVQLKYDNFSYLEHRIFKRYGYESFDEYFEQWHQWDNLARRNNHSSVDNFLFSLLDNRGYQSLLNSERKYRETIGKLQTIYQEHPEVQLLLERENEKGEG